MSAEHDTTTRTWRLWTVLAANLALVGALVVVGISAHSIGVFAEGADYLADAAAIGVSLLAIHLSTRPPAGDRPHSYLRAPHYAALVNAGWLLILSVLVAATATVRVLTGVHEVHGLPILIISGVAAVVMLAGALLLVGDIDDEDLNRRAVLLDTAADAAAAAGVAIAGAVILAAHGLFWLDPAIALLIAAVVGWHAARLLAEVLNALRR